MFSDCVEMIIRTKRMGMRHVATWMTLTNSLTAEAFHFNCRSVRTSSVSKARRSCGNVIFGASRPRNLRSQGFHGAAQLGSASILHHVALQKTSESSPLPTIARPLRDQRVPVRPVATFLDTRCDSRVLLSAQSKRAVAIAGPSKAAPFTSSSSNVPHQQDVSNRPASGWPFLIVFRRWQDCNEAASLRRRKLLPSSS